MRIQVTLEGMEDLERYALRGASSQKILARAMYSEASTVLNESKKIVPVDNGDLKRSGAVEKPKITPTSIDVDITYGGTAADYAFIVHEDPDARHKPGKTYKYLEIPFKARKDVFVRNIKTKFIAWMLGGV